jgi:hypothetical protein
MPKWGPNLDEDFIVDAGSPLTADFADNSRVGRLAGGSGVGQMFLYVDYTKGDETEMDVDVRFSSAEDAPPGETFFTEVISSDVGALGVFRYRLIATENYRIPIQFGRSEDYAQVSVRGTGGAGPFTGTANLFFGIG